MEYSLSRRLGAEFLGTGLLLVTVVGSGILADRLDGGNEGIALMAHAYACGQMLFVLVLMMSPVSGAHFNPAVTLVSRLNGEISTREALAYVATQIVGAIAGMLLAHMMFDVEIFQIGLKSRTGAGQWLAEGVATFGLLLTILRVKNRSIESVGAAVALYVSAAIWFTASMCFANPAVTIARGMTGTYTGIMPTDVPGFLAAQVVGALLALFVERWVFTPDGSARA